MKKQNLKKMAKTITLGLVLGTALTAAQPVWAEKAEIKSATMGMGIATGIYFDKDGFKVNWGEGTTASGQWSTAFGKGTTASGIYSTAFGQNTTASKDYSFAVGYGSKASGTAAVAMGNNTQASKEYSFAMGSGAIASGKAAVAMGQGAQASANSAFAVGYNSEASGMGSVVIGTLAKANSDYAVAIGQGAIAKANNSVAIGQYAVTSLGTITNTIDQTHKEVINEFAVGGGTTTKDSVTTTYYSRITGVADGENAHDAVTLGQMKNAVNGLTYDSSTKKISYTTFGNSTATELVDLSGLGGGDSVVGKAGEISVSEGTGTDAGKKVIGLNSAVTDAIAGLKNAVGDSSSGLVKDMGTVKGYVTSSGLNANSKKITNVANGTADSDAVNYGQVKDGMKGLSFDSATNQLSYTTLGSSETQYVDLSSLAGGGAEVVGKAGEVSVTDGTGADAGKKVIGLSDEVKATLGEVNNLSGQVSRLGTRISKVGAGAAAMASMHPVYDEDSKLTFSAGLGSYRSEKALAIGAFYRPNERVVVNLGSTMGNDDNMVGLGVNFALDRNVGVKLPSKAVMARQLTEQNEKLAEQDARIAEQDARIAKQDKENAEMKKQMMKMMAMINALKKK